MYRVLVPIDTDEDRALAQAGYVANLPDAAAAVEATLLFVFSDEGQEMPADLEPFKSGDRVKSVKLAQEFLEERGVETVALDTSGDTASDIVQVAEERDADEIVMGGRKRSPVGKAVFGSVTQQVILDTETPVVVTGATAE